MAMKPKGPWFRAGKNAWYCTVDGRMVPLGVRGRDNEAEAVKAWHKLMSGDTTTTTRATTTSPPKPPEPDAGGISLRQLADAFLADARGRLKASTVRIYGYDLDSLCESLGSLPANSITAKQIGQWVHRRKINSTTKAMTLRSISACFGWGERNELVPVNVVKRVPKPKSRSRSADTVITEDQHQRLMAVADPEFKLVLMVLWGTGCRPGEAAAITTDNFDPVNGVAKLFVHKTDKTGKPRVIFLPDDIREMLKVQAARYASGALLRSNKGYPWTGRSITEAMRRVSKKTGLKSIAYGYRHSFATVALSRGIPDAQVAALLGHTTTSVLHSHYSHLTSQAKTLRDALGKVR